MIYDLGEQAKPLPKEVRVYRLDEDLAEWVRVEDANLSRDRADTNFLSVLTSLLKNHGDENFMTTNRESVLKEIVNPERSFSSSLTFALCFVPFAMKYLSFHLYTLYSDCIVLRMISLVSLRSMFSNELHSSAFAPSQKNWWRQSNS